VARIPLSTDASASGFALLAALAADATAHGTAATPPPPPKRLGRHVAFDCAATSWLVPIADVAAVARGPRVTRVAGSKSWVRGLALIDGRLTPVIDLARFLGAASSATASTVLVLARLPAAGLIVDQVLGLVVPEDPEPGPDAAESTLEPAAMPFWSRARLQVGPRMLHRFDLDRLLADPEFLDATRGVPDR
jgi:twitching motility protein PilI